MSERKTSHNMKKISSKIRTVSFEDSSPKNNISNNVRSKKRTKRTSSIPALPKKGSITSDEQANEVQSLSDGEGYNIADEPQPSNQALNFDNQAEKRVPEILRSKKGSTKSQTPVKSQSQQNAFPISMQQKMQTNYNFLDELVAKTPKTPAFNEETKRIPTNEAILRLQKPGLLMRQAEFLNEPIEERRKNYIRGVFIELNNIPTWKELGTRLMIERQSRSKAPSKKKSFMNRSPSMPMKDITPEYDFSSVLNEKISIYKGDLAVLEVDAVVISAGASLQKTAMAHTIYEAAGAEMDEEVKLYRQNQNLNVSPFLECQAIVFAGYRLPALYTIHVIYPGRRGLNENTLRTCYLNAFKAATDYDCKSIAFPCIGTGGYGFPSDKACKIALNTARNWLGTEDGRKMERIVFCCFKDNDFEEYRSSTFIYFPLKDTPQFEILKMDSFFGPLTKGFDVAQLKGLCERIENSVKTLDFSECGDSVSDFAFWVINHYKTKGYKNVKFINCTGCNKLTDMAVFAISEAFTNLEELNVTGCLLITEFSLAGVKKSNPNCVLNFIGCKVPLMQPYLLQHENTKPEKKCTSFKIIFLRHFGMQYKTPSLISQMVGKVGKDSNVSKPWEGMFNFDQRVTNDGSVMNLYEINSILLEFISTERSVIVLPSLPIDEGPSFRNLLSTAITHGKGAPIISLSAGAPQVIKTWTEKVDGRIREEVIQKLNLFQWHDSVIAANLFSLKFWLARCKIFHIQAGEITSLNSKDWKSVLQYADLCTPYMNNLPPDIFKSTQNLVKDSNIIKIDPKMERGFYASIVVGTLLKLPSSNKVFNMEAKPGVAVSKLFNSLFSSNKTEGRRLIPWLADDGITVSLKNMETITKTLFNNSNLECENLLDDLAMTGLFYPVTYPWINDHVARPALVPSGTFPKEPPIDIESIWSDAWSDDEQELVMLYSLPFHPSALFLERIFQRLLKLTIPVCVWRYGLLSHIASTEILIKMYNSASDPEGFSLLVGVRGVTFREGSGRKKDGANDPCKIWEKINENPLKYLKESVGQVFQLLRQIIDVCLIETGTYALPQLRCPYCRVKDRVHYYDVQKVLSNPEEPLKCHTFKEKIPFEELFLDKYFLMRCYHFVDQDKESPEWNAKRLGNLRCCMCWSRMTQEIDYYCAGKTSKDSACRNCHMCISCLTRLKKDCTILQRRQGNEIKTPQTQAIDSELQGFECSMCAYKLPNEYILEKHQTEWCPYRLRKLVQKDQQDDQSSTQSLGRIISVKNIPKIVELCLNDNFCSTVDILVLQNPESIFIRSITDKYFSISSWSISPGTVIEARLVRDFDHKALQFSVNGNFIYKSNAKDNFCVVTILLAATQASIMVLPQNKNLHPMIYPLCKGLYLEVCFQEIDMIVENKPKPETKPKTPSRDAQKLSKCYIAAIESFNDEGKIKLSFEDYSAESEKLTFRGYITDDKLHPLGWGLHTTSSPSASVNLILPDQDRHSDQSFDYMRFLDRKVSSNVPLAFFSEKQTSGTIDPLTTGFKNSQHLNQVKIGMKLEAVDRKNPHLTCVATIQAIRPGNRVEIYFDGWSHNFDYVTEINNIDLHPLGYCDHNGISLQPPKGYTETFDWSAYLRSTAAEPVPYQMFTAEQIRSTPMHSAHKTVVPSVAKSKSKGKIKKSESANEMPHFIRFHNLYMSKQHLKAFTPDLNVIGLNEITTPTIPFFVPLPTNVSAERLSYPSRRLALDWSVGKQTLHGLCLHQDTSQDFIRWFKTCDDISETNFQDLEILGQYLDAEMSSLGVFLHISDRKMLLDHNSLSSLSQTAIKPELVEQGTRSLNVPLYTTKYKPKLVETIHSLYESLLTTLFDSIRVLLLTKVSMKDERVVGMADQDISQDQINEGIHRYLYLNLANIFLLTKSEIVIKDHSARFILQVVQWLLGPDNDIDLSQTVSGGMCPLKPSTPEQIDELFRLHAQGEMNLKTIVSLKYPSLTRVILMVERVWDFSIMKTMLGALPKHITFPNILMLAIDQKINNPEYIKLLNEFIRRCPNLKLLFVNCKWNSDLSFLKCQHLKCSLTTLNMRMRLKDGLGGICDLQSLQYLNLRYCAISDIPSGIENLRELSTLDMSGNMIQQIEDNFGSLTSLVHLDVSATPVLIPSLAPYTIQSIRTMLEKHNSPLIWDLSYEETIEKINSEAEKKNIRGFKGTPVEAEHVSTLNEFLHYLSPRIAVNGFAAVFQLSRLRDLQMRNHYFKQIPREVENLKNLLYINLRFCSFLYTIDQHLGTLECLKHIDLEGCSNLQTPPPEVVKRGTDSVIAYLKRLLSGFQECKRTKLMLVGLGGAGKTSLVRALLSGKFQTAGTKPEEITDGIDIVDWSVRVNVAGYQQEQNINYSIWDFAGQSVYYNTHQFFLSNRAVYFLLWNTRLGYEHAGLDFWLSSITCHAPKAPIFVIGTHADQVHRADLPENELKLTFPQIVNFSLISALIGQGVEELAAKLFQVTLQQKYMGERIPTIWLNLEMDIISQRRSQNVVPTVTVESKALNLGLLDMAEVREALRFLHDLGSLQYFSNEFLRNQVVINPQWLVDVMACLVTVKESVIKDGRFNRDDIGIIWNNYDKQLHGWLLQLTEEFDLTYALPTGNINVVPCLLPEQEPAYEWPELNDATTREMKMTYHFEYLPAGLFNRTQTRLCQYADSSVVWKKGSMLRKNQHMALIRQSRDKELVIKVQGPRPENFLFLVHEVIEALVHQFFQGVSYDLSIPCSDCVRVGSQDPNMFSAKQIKRACDMKAPFLQCSKNFHIVAIAALQEFVPPSTVNDFETHLTGMMHELKQLRSNCGSAVLFLCSPKDLKTKGADTFNPKTLMDDLKKAKINVKMFDGLSRGKESHEAVADLAVMLTDCAVAIACISDSFCKDKTTNDLFTFFKQGSHRPIIPVVISGGEDWKKTGVGMLVTTEMYVDMRKMERYHQKLQELISRLNSKLSVSLTPGPTIPKEKHEVFFSYCWANSHDAVKKGTRTSDSALGQVDPRDIEAFLTKNSQKIWMDLRCAKEGVLFEEIAEALRAAKLMVACVSDQYLSSTNCMLEYRFATGILKLPLILCVVGNGNKWCISEITMLALSAPRVDFQTKNTSANAQLLNYIENILEEQRGLRPMTTSTKKRPTENKSQNYSAYAELRELAQRKFLDEASIFASNLKTADSSFSSPYPRLFYIDVRENINIDDFISHPKRKSNRENRNSSTFMGQVSSMSTRPKSAASLDSDAGEPKFSTDFDKMGPHNLCIKLLCEWDGEWHPVGEPIALPLESENSKYTSDLMLVTAPFLAKIYSILQHSPVPVKMLEGKRCDILLTELKRQAQESGIDGTDIQVSYERLARLVRDWDKDMHRGGMMRCSLHSRRILWLCPEHQKKARATIENDAIDTDEVLVNLDSGSAGFSSIGKNEDLERTPAEGLSKGVEGDRYSLNTNYTPEISNNGEEDRTLAISESGLVTESGSNSSRSPSSLAKIQSKMCILS